MCDKHRVARELQEAPDSDRRMWRTAQVRVAQAGQRRDRGPDPHARVDEQLELLLQLELAHAHGIGYAEYGREEAELIVESVAFIVCGSVGLDTSGESVPYLAGWQPDDPGERIRKLAGTIDEIARAIEQALADAGASEAEAA